MTSDLEQRGLSYEEVAQRRADGLVNDIDVSSSRSVGDILRANILTRFNAIISVMVVVVLVFGDWRDALFGMVMVINAVIGIVQELRAKRTLDRLSVLVTPQISVVRADEEETVPIDGLVLDDLVLLYVGDQVPVDGSVVTSEGLQLDESLLTGEADPMDKDPGEEVLSGSFVVAGHGAVRATAVGTDSYAQRLAAEAKYFSLADSELRDGVNKILRIVTWLLIPTSLLLLWSQLNSGQSLSGAMVATVAGVVGMVPQGLVLLVSMAMAVAVIRLGRKNVLVQELPAVETLARVDIICVDKTGTLTGGRIVHESTNAINRSTPGELADALAAIAASDPAPNLTLEAIRSEYRDDPGWVVSEAIPFSSTRKYSVTGFELHGTWILGAPEVVAAGRVDPELRDRLGRLAATGRRILVLARSGAAPSSERLPSDLELEAYLTFTEEIRSDAADTVGYFVAQGVTPKVISGDNRLTVASIATSVGVPDADRSVDARELDLDDPGFVEAVNRNAVFGRVTPEQKREMVDALQAQEHTVAMTGDGVNDVLALKHADIGIAMGTGSPATKAVSQLVLLDNRFATLPSVVAEGRRIIANMERVASLFVTKTVYATVLAIVIGFAGLPFPFLPRHLTLIGTLTIGLPGFFLSFEPTSEPVRSGFLSRVMRFAVPAGLAAAVVTFGLYGLARSDLVDATLQESRTGATITMVMLGFWILLELIRPLDRGRAIMVTSLVAAFGLTLALPFTREFFDLVLPGAEGWAVISVGVLIGMLLIDVSLNITELVYQRWLRKHPDPEATSGTKPVPGRSEP